MWFHAICTLVVVYGALLQLSSAIRHHILTKSWAEAQEDCLAYLRIEGDRAAHYRAHHYGEDELTKGLIFCIVLNLRAYEPQRNAVRPEVLGKFFRPDPADGEHSVRTDECLRRRLGARASLTDHNSCPKEAEFYADATDTVFETFRCFYHHYGNLVGDALPLPPTGLELDQVQQECAQIVALPQDLLRDRLRFRVHPMCDRYRRCVALRSGFTGLVFELDEEKEEMEKVDNFRPLVEQSAILLKADNR